MAVCRGRGLLRFLSAPRAKCAARRRCAEVNKIPAVTPGCAVTSSPVQPLDYCTREEASVYLAATWQLPFVAPDLSSLSISYVCLLACVLRAFFHAKPRIFYFPDSDSTCHYYHPFIWFLVWSRINSTRLTLYLSNGWMDGCLVLLYYYLEGINYFRSIETVELKI